MDYEKMSKASEILQKASDSAPTKIAVGTAGMGISLLDIVNWAQAVSAIGGALIVVLTLLGMVYKAFKSLRK